MMSINKTIQGFEITGCYVRDRNNIAFVCQKWEVNDPLVPHMTNIITFTKNKDNLFTWKTYEIGTTTGLYCCPVFKPRECWVFVSDFSDVFVIIDEQIIWEDKITKNSREVTFNVKCINSFAYSIGPNPGAYRREAENTWIKLDNGFSRESLGQIINVDDFDGFDDIDGFSENDIYACGGDGDLWSFDGKLWSKIDILTNARMQYLCCGDDGLVYVVTCNRNGIFKGRGDTWDFIEKDSSKNELLGNIVWFNGQLHLLTTHVLYGVNNNGFTPIEMSGCHLKSYSRMAARDGILVITSPYEAAIYDGKKWEPIITASSLDEV